VTVDIAVLSIILFVTFLLWQRLSYAVSHPVITVIDGDDSFAAYQWLIRLQYIDMIFILYVALSGSCDRSSSCTEYCVIVEKDNKLEFNGSCDCHELM